MPQEQDPLDKYKVKTESNDPLDRYKPGSVIKPEVENIQPEEIKAETPIKTEEKPKEESWWDWMTRSRLPELNLPEANSYWPGFAKGGVESLYEDVVRPIASPLGAAITVGSGPLMRGALGAAARIPGMSKVGQLLSKEILPGEAPSFVKKTIESLTPKGKVTTPVDTPELTPKAAEVLNPEVVPEQLTPIDKLLGAVRESKPLERKQAKIYSAERASRISEAEKVTTPGQVGFFEKKSKLAGEHSKVQMEPLKLEQPDVDSLYNDIASSPLEPFQRINAGDGLTKILNGEVPQNSEIQLLAKIFGQDKISELASKLPKIKQADLIHEALNVPRAMQTIWDLSMPLRQGKALLMSRDWFRAWPAMVKSAGSEGAYRGVMDSIMKRPNYTTVIHPDGTKEIPFFRKAGLHLTDLTDLSSREESMMSTVVEQAVPLARASNRAATAYVNKLRADHFDRLITAAEKAGLSPKENLDLAQKIAGFVNNATGRGSLGPAEKYAVSMNDVFFSPRFLASRVNMLNPTNYLRLNTPEGRMISKQYWKSMAGLSAAWLTELSLMQAAGADVNWDPTSSDFAKARWGETTFDPGAGFQQPIVLLSRLAQQSYKTMSGNERQYGHGFGSKTMKDAIEEFFANKLAPIPKHFYDSTNASEYQPFDANDRTIRLLVPMVMQDLSEVAQEDPSLLPLLGGAFLGESIQVNNPDLKMFGDTIPTSNIPQSAGPGITRARKGR